MAADDFDRLEDPLAGLAERIADHLASRLTEQLSRLALHAEPSATPELWTARRVASHYGVGTSFVYQHANELGCVRLGGGSRPRLRFDPQVVRQRWGSVGDVLPDTTPTKRRRSNTVSVRRPLHPKANELLDYDREP